MLTRNRMQHLVRRAHPQGDQETTPRVQDQRNPHGLFPIRPDQGNGGRGTGDHPPPSHTQYMVLRQRIYCIYSTIKCLNHELPAKYSHLTIGPHNLLPVIPSCLPSAGECQRRYGLVGQVAILSWKRTIQALYFLVDAVHQLLPTPATSARYRSSSSRDTPVDT